MKNTSFLPAVTKAKAGLLFALFLLCTPALCQQSKLRGQIAVQNSRFDKNGKGEIEYVPFAEVDECSQPRKGHALSDAQGQWAMEVVGIADKEPVFLKVNKEGWQVVNADALQAAAGQTAPVRLYMATSKYITDAKRKYYNTGYTEAEKNLNLKIAAKQKEMDALRQQTGYSEQALRKLQDEYGLVQSQYEKLDALARELSEKYVRINLDDAGQLYQDAFRLFQAGDLDGAMRLWQNANLSKQVNEILEEEKRLGTLKKEVAERDSLKNRRKEDLMQNLLLKADAHQLRLEWDSVEFVYEELIRLDTANLDNIWNFALFLSQQNKTNKAILFGEEALNLARSERDSARLTLNLGNLYTNIQKMGDAEKMYLRSLEIYERLAKANNGQFDPELASIENNLGGFYYRVGKMSEAGAMFHRSLEIRERLAQLDSVQFEPELAKTVLNLGSYFSSDIKKPEAGMMHRRSLEIYERLARSNPNQFEQYLAKAAMNMGSYYVTDKKMPEAETMYRRSLEIYERLAKSNPAQFEPELATIAMNMGNYYVKDKKMPEAETMYLRSLEINERLAQSNPAQFEPELARTAMNMGNYFAAVNKMPEAESMYRHSLKIYERLAQSNPSQFEPELATIAMDIGIFYSNVKKMPEADTMFCYSLEIRERLAQSNPARFKPDLVVTLINFGYFKHITGQWEEAKRMYGQSLGLCRKAVVSGQTNFLKNLNQVYKNMAVLCDSFELQKDYAAVVAIQRERTACMDSLQNIHPTSAKNAPRNYGVLSWHCLLTRQYLEAQTAALRAIDIDPTINWVRTYLGHAHLLRGDWLKAKAVYEEYLKNEADPAEAKKALVKDWDELEAAGITCPEMAKARKWLKE